MPDDPDPWSREVPKDTPHRVTLNLQAVSPGDTPNT